MSDVLDELVERVSALGFRSDLDTGFVPEGLEETVSRFTAARNDEPQWPLGWRLGALRHPPTRDNPRRVVQLVARRRRDRCHPRVGPALVEPPDVRRRRLELGLL
jgi:hypothetical protein